MASQKRNRCEIKRWNKQDKTLLLDICARIKVESIHNPLGKDQQLILAVLIAIAAGISGLANAASLLALPFRCYQPLHKSFLISLSLSDFILGLVVGVDNVVRILAETVEWKLGIAMCQIIPFVTTVCVLASSLLLTMVAVDRYQGLKYLQAKLNPGPLVSLIINVVIWIIAFGVSAPMYLGYTNVTSCVSTNTSPCAWCIDLCIAKKKDITIYFPCLYGIIFLPVLSIFLLSYTMIARHVWNSRQKFQNAAQDQNIRPRFAKKKLRTFKVVIILITAFVLCRLPQWTFTLVSLNVAIKSNAGYVVKYVLSLLTIVSTILNPLLYSFLDNILTLQVAFNRLTSTLHEFRSKLNSSKGNYNVREVY